MHALKHGRGAFSVPVRRHPLLIELLCRLAQSLPTLASWWWRSRTRPFGWTAVPRRSAAGWRRPWAVRRGWPRSPAAEPTNASPGALATVAAVLTLSAAARWPNELSHNECALHTQEPDRASDREAAAGLRGHGEDIPGELVRCLLVRGALCAHRQERRKR
jgi:hypothetical protein